MGDNKIKTRLVYLLIVLIGVFCAFLLYYYKNFYQSEYYMPGVQVANLRLGGITYEEATRDLENNLSSHLDTPVLFVYDSYQYKTKLKDLCIKPAVGKILEDVSQQEKGRNIYSKLINLDGNKSIVYPVKIDYNPEIINEVIKKWQADLDVDYVNASLKIDQDQGLIVIPGMPGKSIDVDQTLAGLPQEFLFEEIKKEIKVPIVIQEKLPLINEKDLQNMGELGGYTTGYNPGEIDRTHNVKKASDSINGVVLAPGEVFSFNQTVGPRTYATGYRDALVIVGGLFEPGLGGGICQVSSTLYNAVLLAGMDIVERHNHALAVAYVQVGRDATVAYGLQDFKFRNNTNFPVYIRSITAGGKLTVNIYGDMNYKQKIVISNVVDNRIPFTEIRELDTSLEPGMEKVKNEGISGYVVRSFRTFYDQDDNEIKTEQLATDRYTPLNKLFLVGPELTDNNPDNMVEEQEFGEEGITDFVPPEAEDNNILDMEKELITDPI